MSAAFTDYKDQHLGTYAALHNAVHPLGDRNAVHLEPTPRTAARLLMFEGAGLRAALNLEWRGKTLEVTLLTREPSPEIAAILCGQAVSSAREFGARGLQVWVRETDAFWLGFYRAQGWEEHTRIVDSTLTLGDAKVIRDNHTALQIVALGTQLHDETFLRGYHAAMLEVLNDVPPVGTPSDWTFEDWRAGLSDAHALPQGCFAGLFEGEIVAISELMRLENPDVLHTGLSGARRTHRRRGYTRALKLEAIHYALEHGYTAIRSSVHIQNTAMLALNAGLGFVPIHARTLMRSHLD